MATEASLPLVGGDMEQIPWETASTELEERLGGHRSAGHGFLRQARPVQVKAIGHLPAPSHGFPMGQVH
jgi:hypothetical protein